MRKSGIYRIPFVGLKLGLHHFNYEVKDKFFRAFEGSLIKKAKVFVDLAFEKRERLFILIFDVSGSVNADCDRCGQPFELPIHGYHKVIVKFGVGTGNEDEDIIFISPEDSHLELEQLIYEYINLSIPIKKIHPDITDGKSGCDEKALAYLSNLNNENSNTDPRWDKLKSLKKNS